MSHFLHDLHSEFPSDGDILHRLKLTDPAYLAMADEYHTLNKEIQRIESGIEASSDDRLETLKKQRLKMLDGVAVLIDRAKAA